MFVFYSDELVSIGYTNSNFQFGKNSCKCTSRYVYTLGGILFYFSIFK